MDNEEKNKKSDRIFSEVYGLPIEEVEKDNEFIRLNKGDINEMINKIHNMVNHFEDNKKKDAMFLMIIVSIFKRLLSVERRKDLWVILGSALFGTSDKSELISKLLRDKGGN